jgi:hypothetical protein
MQGAQRLKHAVRSNIIVLIIGGSLSAAHTAALFARNGLDLRDGAVARAAFTQPVVTVVLVATLCTATVRLLAQVRRPRVQDAAAVYVGMCMDEPPVST